MKKHLVVLVDSLFISCRYKGEASASDLRLNKLNVTGMLVASNLCSIQVPFPLQSLSSLPY